MRAITVGFLVALLFLVSPTPSEARPRFGQQRGWANQGQQQSQVNPQNRQQRRLRDGSCNQGACPRFNGQGGWGRGAGRGWAQGPGQRQGFGQGQGRGRGQGQGWGRQGR